SAERRRPYRAYLSPRGSNAAAPSIPNRIVAQAFLPGSRFAFSAAALLAQAAPPTAARLARHPSLPAPARAQPNVPRGPFGSARARGENAAAATPADRGIDRVKSADNGSGLLPRTAAQSHQAARAPERKLERVSRRPL